MSIYKPKNSKFWYVSISPTASPHDRVRRSLKTTDKYLARIKAKDLEQRLLSGNVPAKHLPFQEFVQKYFSYIESRLRQSSIKAFRIALNNLLQFKNFTSLHTVTIHESNEFVLWMLKKPVSSNGTTGTMKPVSVNTNLRHLRIMWNWALKMNYVAENVWQKIPYLSYQQPEPRVLNRNEIKKMLSSADALYPQYADLFRFYLLTGMRLSEALSLQWSNIDFAKKAILLTKTKGKYNRMVMLLPATIEILKKRKNLEMPFPYRARWIARIYKMIVEHAAIKHTSIQDLRATTYSYLVSRKVSQLLIRKIIGHVSDRTGQVHYFNMDITEVLEQTKELNSLIG